ncbi:MAG: LD-carboxypeptidase [Methylacidiphilales bacterium]|nr:LD-carboxypeptidase [Candidatus Methylacidiphilales bacterium]
MSAPSILFPRKLRQGDTIGLAAPASPPEQADKIDEVIARFTACGFRLKLGRNLRQRTGYLAGSDKERAADINTLFADRKVDAVFALRGGYGSCRILPLLDYKMIRANPKPFIGYSDITAMHNAILRKSGLITFHGSNASSAFETDNAKICRKILMEPAAKNGTILFSRETTRSIKTVVAGKISGRLIGGNMTCLLRLLGTPYAPDFRRVILFLEDTGEKAYRVDGLFCHLRLAGITEQIGGLILGQFDHPDPGEEKRVQEVLRHEAKRIGVPAIVGAPIGHFAGQVIIPHGIHAAFDATKGLLKF